MGLTGCAQSPATSPGTSPVGQLASPATATPAASSSAKSDEEAAAGNRTISSQGIGAAKLGMTLGELKKTLGNEVKFTVKSPFIVDFDAIAVEEDNKVQYYILYLAGQSFQDSDIIQGLLTENSDFKTSEGIGPDTLIAEAEKKYGKVTLSYNTQNESREYARFERQPANSISFGTGNGNQETAGVYQSPTTEYNETQSYQEGAKIQSVLVICSPENCTSPSPNPNSNSQ